MTEPEPAMGFRQLYRPPATVRAYVFILLASNLIRLLSDQFGRVDAFDVPQPLPWRFFIINIVARMLPPVLLAEGVWRRRSRFVWIVALIYTVISIVGFFASWSFSGGSISSALGPASVWIYTLIPVVELTLLLMPATRAWVRGPESKVRPV
ncbi:MAG TPA: hypothetical protein VE174_15250 [Actinomycetota bacterium]|nr:hypothetical protein [Actinomycetota bacterium]